jgi:cell division protein FtsB
LGPGTGCLGKRVVMKGLSPISRFPRPEGGLRAIAERVPQAEAMAASWIEVVRPTALRIYALRRRIATITVGLVAAALFVHVMFGANGMVIYKQKRAEYETLRQQISQKQQQNDRYTQEIQGLKSDQTAIEKEAREQLGYAKPGEYVYVPPTPAKPAPVPNHTAKK